MGSEQSNNSGNDGASPGRKSLWDKVGLLSNIAMPIMLGVATIVVSVVLTVSSGRSENQRAQATALESYLSEMTGLIADNKFFGIETDLDSSARNAVRARTLGVLSRLNPQQKGFVIQFLYEADLISGDSAIDLGGADLSQANLKNQVLVRVNLSDTNLKEADLSHTVLFEADLSRADLSGANLKVADLEGANLRSAVLNRADLSGASLILANLFRADLKEAKLSNASLEGSNFKAATYDVEQLSQSQQDIINDPVIAWIFNLTTDLDVPLPDNSFLDSLFDAYDSWDDGDYENAIKNLEAAEDGIDKNHLFYTSEIGNLKALVLATLGSNGEADYVGALDTLNKLAEARQDDNDKGIVEDLLLLDTIAFVYLMKGVTGDEGINDLEWALQYYEKIRKVRPELDLWTNLGLGLVYYEINDYKDPAPLFKSGLNQLIEESETNESADPQLRQLVSMLLLDDRALSLAIDTGDRRLGELAFAANDSFYKQSGEEATDYFGQDYDLVDLIREFDDSITVQETDFASSSDYSFDGDLFDEDYGKFLVISGFVSLGFGDKSGLDFALSDFSEAIDLFPKFADAFVGRAMTYALLGQHEMAAQDIDEAERLGINRDGLEFINRLANVESRSRAPDLNFNTNIRQF